MSDVAAYLDAQVRALRETGARLDAGEERSVHQHRVAVRRIRSTLRTFREVLPDNGDLDGRLREHGARLGEVRDLEVLRDTLGSTPDGPTRDRLQEAVTDELEGRRAALLGWLRSPELALLVEDVAAYVEALPEDGPDLTPYVKTARRRARTRLRQAGSDAGRLHRARNAAKRARYAAEVVGDDEAAGRQEHVQRYLGTHHDCAVAIEHLRGASVVPDSETAAMIAELERSAEEARLRAVARP